MAPSAPIYDFKALPLMLLRILKDPWGSLEAYYKPGKPALIGGAIIGGGTVILIPLLQALFVKMASSYNLSAGTIFKGILGGVVFLAVGVALSFFLRKALGKSPGSDWQDDVYLFGGSLLFLLLGTIVSGILMLINNEAFFRNLAHVTVISAVLLTTFTYYFGMVKVGRTDAGRAIWVAVIVFAGATLVGSLLNFSIEIGRETIAADMSSRMNDAMPGQNEYLREMQKMQQQGFPR